MAIRCEDSTEPIYKDRIKPGKLQLLDANNYAKLISSSTTVNIIYGFSLKTIGKIKILEDGSLTMQLYPTILINCDSKMLGQLLVQFIVKKKI